MPPTIDERLLLKKYALLVTKLEEHKKEAAKSKVADDAEAAKKKKLAAAVDAFKAAQARLGVTPQPVASAATQRAVDPPPKRPVRSLAEELADDDDDDASPPRPSAAAAKAAPAANVQGGRQLEKSKPTAAIDGAEAKGTKRGRGTDVDSQKDEESQEGAPQKRRQGAAPRLKESEGNAKDRTAAPQPSAREATAGAAAAAVSRPDRGPRAGKGRGEPGQRVRKPQRNPAATVFVGNLPPGTSDDDLGAAFADFGELMGARVVPSKAYGFVDFKNEADARSFLANAEAHIEVQGRAVRVGPSGGALPEWQKGATAPPPDGTRGSSANEPAGGAPPRPVHAPPARPPPESIDLPDERQQIVYDDI